MITIEEKIAAVLSPVFGDEIYPIAHPDPDGTMGSVANLYAVYTKIGGSTFQSLNGDTDLRRVRIQISIYSISYSDLKVKEKAANDAMRAANVLANQYVNDNVDSLEVLNALPNVSVSVPSEGREEDTRRYFNRMEFYAWQRG